MKTPQSTSINTRSSQNKKEGSEQIFFKSYNQLNAEQKEAVDCIEGPVVVIAGPGTGKTTMLTLRIANILRLTDTAPESILALTFTESAVHAMRKKLANTIGSRAYSVALFTFHGFCNEIIRTYPESFQSIISSSPSTESEQIQIIEYILGQHNFEHIKPYGDNLYYVLPLLSQIKQMKREYVSVENFRTIIAEEKKAFSNIDDLIYETGAHTGKMKGKYKDIESHIKKAEELVLVYEAYEKELSKRKLYDFEDMIVKVVTTLSSNEDLLLQVQEQYQYVLADEHQDANESQNKLLELISSFHASPNLFIVGDEKQAIFRFQGASLSNFLYFAKKFPTAKKISLKENYRSHQHILDASHALISNTERVIAEGDTDEYSLRIRLEAKSDIAKASIAVLECSNRETELVSIAEHIKKAIEEGQKPSEIAVIFRDNKDAEGIARALSYVGVPFIQGIHKNLFSEPIVYTIVQILKVVHDVSNNESFGKVLCAEYFKLSIIDVSRILQYVSRKRVSVYEVISSKDILKEIGVSDIKKIDELAQKFNDWVRLAKNTPVITLVDSIIKQSGIIEFALGLVEFEKEISSISLFFNQISSIVERKHDALLSDFLQHINILEQYKIKIDLTDKNTTEAVRLMTAHKSKGLEFESVYILHAEESKWSNRKGKTYFTLPKHVSPQSHIDDERRLFYVALTRARKNIVVSYAISDNEGKPKIPSQFIAELTDTNVTKEYITEHKHVLAVKQNEKQAQALALNKKEYFNNLFFEYGLSVTALNNFLQCPAKYFFTNLLRLPQVQHKSALYGTAIHDTLKAYMDAYKVDNDMSLAQILLVYEQQLSKKALTQSEYEELLKKGTTAVEGYLATFKDSFLRTVSTEYSIRGIVIPVMQNDTLYDIPLTGKLDKIEYIDDVHVRVFDYKTKAPMTRNEIEGNTKSSNGDYKRQLVFYKLILDMQSQELGKPISLIEASLDFIEPNEKGIYKRESFVITDDEVNELRNIIGVVSQKIIACDFFKSTCDDPECEFCKLMSVTSLKL